MINADNIGKRIRMLRKQKRVSQERMAEDLGMYQADISNLERAIGGSGITDLFKLDMIADYFGISLIELLNGFEKESSVNASKNSKPEEYAMKDFIIKDVLYCSDESGFISEIKLAAPDNQITFISFAEIDDEPHFYKTRESIYEQLQSASDDPTLLKKLNQKCFLYGSDYVDVFQKVTPENIDICRYLIFIATEDEDSVNEMATATKGKTFAEINVPVPSREPEDLFYVNYSDLANVYRYRLMVEANIKNPSVYSDMDNISKREKAILEKLKAACVSEEAYKVWKKDLIDAKLKEVIAKQKIVVCTYLFAGLGQYKEMMPEEMVESFKCWIDHNGSAFFGGCRPATKREIRTYVSQHIADELLGIDGPLI